MIRRLTSVLAAIALVSAMAAPPVSACERANAASTAAVTDGSAHSMHDATSESDCPEPGAPAGDDHDADCQAMCLSMAGCSASSFVVEAAALNVPDEQSQVPMQRVLAPSGPSAEPDRPPPRR